MLGIDSDNIRHILTRIGIAAVFIAFGVWEILNPLYWAAFLPPFLTGVASPSILLTVHGTILILLGLAILTGFHLRIAAILSSIIMLAIIASLIMLTGYNDLLVRDVGLFFLVFSIVFDKRRYLTLTK